MQKQKKSKDRPELQFLVVGVGNGYGILNKRTNKVVKRGFKTAQEADDALTKM